MKLTEEKDCMLVVMTAEQPGWKEQLQDPQNKKTFLAMPEQGKEVLKMGSIEEIPNKTRIYNAELVAYPYKTSITKRKKAGQHQLGKGLASR